MKARDVTRKAAAGQLRPFFIRPHEVGKEPPETRNKGYRRGRSQLPKGAASGMAGDDTSTEINLLDDATRPKAPRIEGITEAQRHHGKSLALIHNYHLAQMNEVRRMMERVEAGEQNAATLVDAISSMQMVANYRMFGNLCGRECHMLTLHHAIEDESIFPVLREGSDGLRKVVERLRQEHAIVHQLLERLHAHAVEAVKEPGPETFAALKTAFLALDRVVRSHFGYEQEELEEALGYFAVPL